MPQTSKKTELQDTLESVPEAHTLEAKVHRELLSDAGLDFSSLVIRRIPNGVCLQGVLELDEDEGDAATAAMRVEGVAEVRNELVICRKAK